MNAIIQYTEPKVHEVYIDSSIITPWSDQIKEHNEFVINKNKNSGLENREELRVKIVTNKD